MNLFMVVVILISLGASADAAKPPAPEMPAVPDVIGDNPEPYYPLDNPPVYVPVAPPDPNGPPAPEMPAVPAVIGDVDPFAPQPLDPMGDVD